MKFACPHCQNPLEADDSFSGTTVECPVCGQSFTVEAPQPASLPRGDDGTPHEKDNASAQKPEAEKGSEINGKSRPAAAFGDKVKKSVGNMHEKFNDFTGLEKLEGFSLIGLFSEIFGKHKTEDIEESFAIGTPGSTPSIEQVDTRWPKPWMFFRALAATIALYTLLGSGVNSLVNLNQTLISGMVLMGTLAVPVSALLFFFEVNVRKNISLYQVLKLVCLGGAWSMLVSTVAGGLFGEMNDVMRAALSGPIDETAKLMVLVVLARSLRYPYKLNGLLLGAAIGTGFAVFESMEFAIMEFNDTFANNFLASLPSIDTGNIDPRNIEQVFKQAVDSAKGWAFAPAIDAMKAMIFVRGIFSPFGHIVWTAIAGAALWRVKGSKPFQFSMFGNGKFWHLFLIPVVLHSLWNVRFPAEWPFLAHLGKYLLLGFAAWFIVIALVQEGLKEIRAEKRAALEKAAASGNPEARAAPETEDSDLAKEKAPSTP